jgi:LysR family transcriptional regulator, transcription activator of glutamate synthase operon
MVTFPCYNLFTPNGNPNAKVVTVGKPFHSLEEKRMNFRQLDCFMLVAEHLSFSKAAEKLFLSQSAVSQQVISLENELGYQLFVRDLRQVKLTPAGEYLYQRFNSMKPVFVETLRKASDIAESSPVSLSIGYDGLMTEVWFGSTVQRFHDRYPDAILRMRKEPVFYLTDLVLNGSLDLIITHELEIADHPNIKFQPLLSAGPCAYLPMNHPLSQKTCIHLEDLKNEILLADSYSDSTLALTKTGQHFNQVGVDYSNAQPVNDGEVIFSMVEAGLGIFLASHLCDGFIKNSKVLAVDLDIGFGNAILGIAWKQDSQKINDYIACARDVLVHDPKYIRSSVKTY